MKIKSLLLAITFVTGIFAAKADNASLFQYDKNAVNKEMTQLNKVENYVNTHEGVTLEQLKIEGNDVVQNLNISSSSMMNSLGDGPLGIPSFVWGLCLGWIGILVTYLVTQDTDETKKALWGCLVSTAVWVIFYVIYVALVVSTVY